MGPRVFLKSWWVRRVNVWPNQFLSIFKRSIPCDDVPVGRFMYIAGCMVWGVRLGW